MNTEIWLDLEETVIYSWNDAWFTGHCPKIKSWLDFHNPTEINIWSFAIWSQEDRDYFVNSGLKEEITKELGYRISKYPDIPTMMEWIYAYEKIKYENLYEFAQLNGKAWSFIKYAMTRQNVKMFLVDDAVPTMELKLPEQNVEIYLLNVARDIWR
jgi:hypothetical protein